MGANQQSKSKFEEIKHDFTKSQMQQIKDTCIKLLNISSQDEKMLEKNLKTAIFEEQHFIKLFSNDEKIGSYIFKWIQSLKQDKIVNVDIFIDVCEYLIQSTTRYQFEQFNERHLESIELFICIVLGLDQKNYSDQQKLNRDQVTTIFQHIFLMFGQSDPKLEKSLIRGIFFEDDQEIKISSMIFKLKENMQYINRFIKSYFSTKFLERKKTLFYPQLNEKSYVLSQAAACFYHLNGIGMTNCDGFHQLYSTHTSGSSFNRLAFAVKGYNAPTLLLIKHVETTKEGEKIKHVFGGYNATEWEDSLKFQGSSDNFLFKLKPQQKNFYVYNGEGGQNFTYMNTKFIDNSKYKVGLGFGGNESVSKFRIWIDDEVETKSFTMPEDKSYANGFLLDSNIDQLNILTIEVWGIGNQANLIHQQEYRIRQEEELNKRRKVDKKQMFSGGIGKMLMGDLMKHREECREDVFKEDEFSDEDRKIK